MLPALGDRSRSLQIEASLPTEIGNLFNTAETLNAQRNRTMLAEAVYIAALLNQVGIQPVALKGLAYLLTGAYPNPGVRYLLDIDLLIPVHQIPSAAACLKQNGYFESESDKLIQFRHHLPAFRRAGSTAIELHHRLGREICDRLLPASTMIAAARPLTRSGATFLIPSPTHLVSHLIIHSQLAHPYQQRIFPPLRALVDLIQLQHHFGPEIDWPSLVGTYRANGEYATLALHLEHANRVLGFPMDPSVGLGSLSLSLRLRQGRRRLLNRHPTLRFFDPTYLFMSLFSRRLRLMPQILRTPSSWPMLLRTLTSLDFYRNLFAV
jgi:hypothetical protein